MLGIRTRKEAALRNLLNTADGDPVEYPEKITLPVAILERSIEAVEATNEDVRERAVSFRFRSGQWRGGKTILGTALEYDEELDRAKAGIPVNPFTLLINRPHLMMHTHPTGTSEKVQAILDAIWGDDAEKDKDDVSDSGGVLGGMPSICYSLPSKEDVWTIAQGGGCSVAGLVSSKGGNFLMVTQRPLRQHVPYDFGVAAAAYLARRKAVHERIFSEAVQTYYGDEDLHDLSEAAVPLFQRAVVDAATAGKLACYYSSDPESLTLDRLR